MSVPFPGLKLDKGMTDDVDLPLPPGVGSGMHAVLPTRRALRPTPNAVLRAGRQLQPTLFDRLHDEAPSRQEEAAFDGGATASQMRDIVQRDLSYLLNTTNAEDLIDRARYPLAAASTINFGVPPLAGTHLSERRWETVEQIIRRAIADYEPRLIPETVVVRPLMREEMSQHYNVLLFEIRAMLDLKPYPLEFAVQSSVDLESRRMTVSPSSGGSARLPV